MMRIATVLCALALSASGQAFAAPAYLTCDFTLEGKPYPVSVTADEQNGRVSIMSNTSGKHEVFQGVFTANAVVFSNRDDQYIIDRTSLEALWITPVLNTSSKAKCRINTPPPGRAF